MARDNKGTQNAHVTLLARFAAAPRSHPPGVSLSRPPPPKQTRGALIEPSSHFVRGGAGVLTFVGIIWKAKGNCHEIVTQVGLPNVNF